MKLVRGFKTELAPNNVQRSLLARTAGCARFAYNWGLARRIEEYKATGKSGSAIDQHKQLNCLKESEFPWMYEVSKCAPQEALRDLDAAYKGFFRRVKAGEKPGFPRFRSVSRYDSFTTEDVVFGKELLRVEAKRKSGRKNSRTNPKST